MILGDLTGFLGRRRLGAILAAKSPSRSTPNYQSKRQLGVTKHRLASSSSANYAISNLSTPYSNEAHPHPKSPSTTPKQRAILPVFLYQEHPNTLHSAPNG